ncbi:MAG: hypothetical protein RL745_418 [Actinomycetota bacterium]|jgi:hypothetical protein
MTPEIIDSLQKRFGSADFSRYQVVRGQKYDFVRLAAAGTNSVSFFSNPIGATDPGAGATLFKTLEQTNLVKNASFGQEYFALTQIRTYANFVCQSRQGFTTGTNFTYRGYTALTNSAMEQLQTVLNLGVLEIKFAQKLYYQIARPFVQCPPGFGIDIQSLASSRTGNAAETQVSGTNWSARADSRGTSVYNIDPIQIIEPEIQIQAAINFPNGNTPNFTNTALDTANGTQTPAVELGLIFDGYVIRPSQ